MSIEQLKKNSSWGPLILRVATGLIFLLAGYGKVTGGLDPLIGMLAFAGGAAVALAWVIAIIELVGGAMLILGLYTRIAATPLAIIMVVSTIMLITGGQDFGRYRLDVILLAANAALIFLGSGKWALKEA